jgi:hypothetical protein
VGDGKQPAGKFSSRQAGEPEHRGCGKNPQAFNRVASVISAVASVMANARKLCALVNAARHDAS